MWGTQLTDLCFYPSGNHKAKAGEEVQRGGYAIAYEQQKRRSLRHFWGSISHVSKGGAENKDKSNSWLEYEQDRCYFAYYVLNVTWLGGYSKRIPWASRPFPFFLLVDK